MRDWKSTAAFEGLGRDESTSQDPLWKQEMDRDRRDTEWYDRQRPQCGPNKWDQIGPNDFGRHFDFAIIDQRTRFVIETHSEAALQYCYRFLPEDQERWGGTGFIINLPLEHWHAKVLLDDMSAKGLRSEDEALAEDDELRRQW